MRLAAEAVIAALADAGLTAADVDGLMTFTMDSNTQVAVARATGIRDLKFFSNIPSAAGRPLRPSSTPPWRSRPESRMLLWRIALSTSVREFDSARSLRLIRRYRLVRCGQLVLLYARPRPRPRRSRWWPRIRACIGRAQSDFGAISVADRKHAANNPAAHFYGKPITLEEHQASRWIAEPLQLLDCCQETDGGVAIVMSAERAKDLNTARGHRRRRTRLRRGPVLNGQLLPPGPDGLPEMGLVGEQLWAQ